MRRDQALARLEGQTEPWDLLIIGGGATGLGCAIDASARSRSTLLVEMHDFAKATSSRSTKLVHGGVRYLQQGNIALVLEALRERGRLQQNAPHLVSNLAFVVPNYDWWEGPFYGIGLKIYDMLAGKEGFGPSKHLDLEETLEHIPTIEPKGLRGGTIYYDGQFDDARLAINMAQTAVDLGGTVANYMKVVGLIHRDNMVQGVVVQDMEGGKEYSLKARSVINATGIFTDNIRKMDDGEAKTMVQPSQGVHIVLDRSFLPGNSAIMVPHTDDGRVLFAIPWYNRVVGGTTDTPLEAPVLEPRAKEEELAFLLEHSQRYLTKDPTPADVLSTFAGIRPLVRAPEAETTAELSRDHVIQISNTGLVTIAGGKWTTYRKMGEDVIDQAATIGGLPERHCPTKNLHIHGWHEYASEFGELSYFGADAPALKTLMKENPDWSNPLHPNLTYKKGEVIWAVRKEMARTVEDVLSRRTRALLLDARASIEIGPEVARLMAAELNQDADWEETQVASFGELAAGYLI